MESLAYCEAFFISSCVEWLKQVTKYHNEWVAIMQSFGAKDHSEDIVQEVYLRLIKGADLNKLFIKGKLNKSYVYFSLRNTWIIHIRKQRNNNEKSTEHTSKGLNRLVHLDNSVYFENEESESTYYDRVFFRVYMEQNELTFNEITMHPIDKNLKHNKFEIILEKIEEEMNRWHWYDKMLFNEYVTTGKSIRTLAKETKISPDSIFQTLKNCKSKLKEVIGEDYDDFKNLDYEYIK